MTFDEIIGTIETLSHSQGFYCRLLDSINNLDDDSLEQVKQELKSQNFRDPIDVILYFEC